MRAGLRKGQSAVPLPAIALQRNHHLPTVPFPPHPSFFPPLLTILTDPFASSPPPDGRPSSPPHPLPDRLPSTVPYDTRSEHAGRNCDCDTTGYLPEDRTGQDHWTEGGKKRRILRHRRVFSLLFIILFSFRLSTFCHDNWRSCNCDHYYLPTKVLRPDLHYSRSPSFALSFSAPRRRAPRAR